MAEEAETEIELLPVLNCEIEIRTKGEVQIVPIDSAISSMSVAGDHS